MGVRRGGQGEEGSCYRENVEEISENRRILVKIEKIDAFFPFIKFRK